MLWLLGQEAKTLPSHGGIMGSIPVGVTKKETSLRMSLFFMFSYYFMEAFQPGPTYFDLLKLIFYQVPYNSVLQHHSYMQDE